MKTIEIEVKRYVYEVGDVLGTSKIKANGFKAKKAMVVKVQTIKSGDMTYKVVTDKGDVFRLSEASLEKAKFIKHIDLSDVISSEISEVKYRKRQKKEKSNDDNNLTLQDLSDEEIKFNINYWNSQDGEYAERQIKGYEKEWQRRERQRWTGQE